MLLSSTAFPVASVGDSLHLARRFYEAQEYVDALRYYRAFLNENKFVDHYGAIVIEASLTLMGVQQQVPFIQEYLAKAPTLDDKALIYQHLAFLHEYLGDYTTAINHYILAYEHSRPVRYELYLRVAKLSFELGEYERSLYMARRVKSETAMHPALHNEILLVMIRSVLMLPDNINKLEAIIQHERLFMEEHAQANLLYLLYLGYSRNHEFAKSQEYKLKLIRRYPESPEAQEVQGYVKRSIAPSLLWW
ncbi:hypothetical protein [Entomospira culicis]|nr:hypothetical protein [Entomospira culicis]WDI37073.1 hypothetical protein PVA46_07065 [Entomospira culicis]